MAKRAILKLGYSCNNNCIFCHSKPKRKYGNLKIEEIEKKILRLKELNVDEVIFSGGEPTIRKDFFKIAEFAKRNNLGFGIITNGRMLSSQQFLNKAVILGLRYCYISLHSSKQEVHDKITGDKSFRQTVEGIKKINSVGVESIVNVVVNQINVNELKKIVDFSLKIGVKHLKFSFVEPVGLVNQDLKKIAPQMKFAAEKAKEAIDYAKGKGLKVSLDGFPLCLIHGYEHNVYNLDSAGITYISEVYDDDFCMADAGNKVKLSFCNECDQYKECEGIYERYIEIYGEEEFIKAKGIRDIRLVLLVTHSCCLKCRYCFVQQEPGQMSLETIKDCIDFLFTSKKDSLQLHYFGGEPFMIPFDCLKKSIEYAVKKSKETGKKLRILITTNGICADKRRLEFLKKYSDYVTIELSLDGDKKSQNLNRPQHDSKNSYELMVSNFANILNSGIRNNISMVISPYTVDRLKNNLKHLISLGFKNIFMMTACGIKWSNFKLEVLEKNLAAIEDFCICKIKEGRLNLLNRTEWMSPFRMNTQIIVDIDGKIYPACISYLIHDKKTKEKYALGNVKEAGKKGIDYYEERRMLNNDALNVIFRENNILGNLESNFKAGNIMAAFVRRLNSKLI